MTDELEPGVAIPRYYGMYHPPSFRRSGHPVEYRAALVNRGYWASLSQTDIMVLRPGGKVLHGQPFGFENWLGISPRLIVALVCPAERPSAQGLPDSPSFGRPAGHRLSFRIPNSALRIRMIRSSVRAAVGRMKAIAVIERPAIIRRILDHLGLPTTPPPSLRAPPDARDDLVADHPLKWSSEPIFEDLPVPHLVIA